MHVIIAKRIDFEYGFVDHINRNGLDNYRCNLRPATRLQNRMNCGLSKRNKSGFKGVSWHKSCNKWVAKIEINDKSIYLGLFDDKIEAAKAYNAAAKKHFGEFAWLNPIPGED